MTQQKEIIDALLQQVCVCLEGGSERWKLVTAGHGVHVVPDTAEAEASGMVYVSFGKEVLGSRDVNVKMPTGWTRCSCCTRQTSWTSRARGWRKFVVSISISNEHYFLEHGLLPLGIVVSRYS